MFTYNESTDFTADSSYNSWAKARLCIYFVFIHTGRRAETGESLPVRRRFMGSCNRCCKSEKMAIIEKYTEHCWSCWIIKVTKSHNFAAWRSNYQETTTDKHTQRNVPIWTLRPSRQIHIPSLSVGSVLRLRTHLSSDHLSDSSDPRQTSVPPSGGQLGLIKRVCVCSSFNLSVTTLYNRISLIFIDYICPVISKRTACRYLSPQLKIQITNTSKKFVT